MGMNNWKEIIDVYITQKLISGKILKKIPGGVTVDVMGQNGFLPWSQIPPKLKSDPESITEHFVDFSILKLNAFGDNIVVSRQAVLEKEKEIYKVQAMNAGKPEAIAEKIVLGKIQSFYKEVCLVDQPFVKDDKLSVKAYCDQVAKQLGGEVRLVKFIRFVTGEGIEKKQENFAEEIAKQISDAAK